MITNRCRTRLRSGTLNWGTTDVRIVLLSVGSVGATLPAGALDPDLTSLAGLLAVSGVGEVSSTRQALTGETATSNTTADREDLTCTAPTWASLTAIVGGCALYVEGASDAARDLLVVHTWPGEQLTAAPYTVTWPGGIVLQIVEGPVYA